MPQALRAGKGVLLTLGLAAFIDWTAEIIFVINEIIGHTIRNQTFDTNVLTSPAKMDPEINEMCGFSAVLLLNDTVEWNHDAHIQPQCGQIARKRSDDVGQAARFGERRAFRTDDQNRCSGFLCHQTFAPFGIITGYSRLPASTEFGRTTTFLSRITFVSVESA